MQKYSSQRIGQTLFLTVLIAAPLLYAITRHPTYENILQILILTVLLPIFLIDYELGFLALIVLRPAMDTFSQIDFLNVGQFSLNLSSVVGLLVIAWILFYLIRRQQRVWKQPLFWPFFIFVIISVISLFYTPSLSATIREVVRIASIFFIYLMAGAMVVNRKGAARFLKAIALSSIIPITVALYQFFTQTGLSFAGLNNRVYGTLVHPNAFATYLLIIFILGFGYFLSHRQEGIKKHGWLIIGLLLTIGLLILTYTRGAWICFGIIVFIMGLKYYKKVLVALFGLAMFLLLFGPTLNRFIFTNFDYDFSRNPVIQRLTEKNSDAESSIDWRFKVWTEMSRKIADRPYLGYGFGAFPVIRQQFVKGMYESTEAHNDYLRLVIELGLVGILAYLVILGKLVYNIFQHLRAKLPATDKAWLYSGLSLIAAVLVMSISDNVLQGTANMWLFWAGMAVLQKLPTLK